MTIKDTPTYHHLRERYIADSIESVAGLNEVSLEQAFANSGIDKYITVESAKLMMKKDFKIFKINKAANISLPNAIYTIIGLTEFSDQKDAESVVMAVNSYWNSLVAKKYPGKFPKDLRFESIDVFPWQEAEFKATKALRANKLTKSIKIYNELFSGMLKYGLVSVNLYRIIVNSAIAHVANGDLLFGLHLLDQALKICSDYEFGIEKRKEIKKFVDINKKSWTKKGLMLEESLFKVQLAESPIIKYIDWFMSTDINLGNGDG